MVAQGRQQYVWPSGPFLVLFRYGSEVDEQLGCTIPMFFDEISTADEEAIEVVCEAATAS